MSGLNPPWSNPPQSSEQDPLADFVKEFAQSSRACSVNRYATKLFQSQAQLSPPSTCEFIEAHLNEDQLQALRALRSMGAKLGKEFTAHALKREWRKLLLKFHPDRGLERHSTKVIALQTAYLALKKSSKKAA